MTMRMVILCLLALGCSGSDGESDEGGQGDTSEPVCSATALVRDYCRSAGYGSGMRCDQDAYWPPECMALDIDPNGVDVCCP